MKKILTVLFCLSLTVLAGSLTACQQHEHSFAETLSYDETGHWYAATCEHTEEKSCLSFHTFGEWQTVIEPTYEAKGEEKRSCICGYYETRDVDPIPRSLGLEYTKTADDTYVVSGIGTCTDTDVIIPETHNGKAVTGIENDVFWKCYNLTSVVIPDSVTSIGKGAFERCTSLTSVTIGNSVTSISEDAFFGCTSLTSVIIPDSVTSIGDSAFANCTSLTSVVIPDGVTSIGEYAFVNCTSLTSVTIGNSVTSIGEDAFNGCPSLTSITVNENNTAYQSIDGNLYTKDGKTLVQYAVGKTDTSFTIPSHVIFIGNNAFSNCASLTSVVIPDSVTSIGDGAFYKCANLTGVIIPNSVTSIGWSAFYKCTNLTSIEIPNSVTSIGYAAFWECTRLTSVTIGNSVTSIGEYAFYDCTRLTSVTIGNSVTSIGEHAFDGYSSLTRVYYGGTESDWTNITIGKYNTDLTFSAHRYYYTETQPTEEGNYWHYDEEGNPVVWE